MKYLYLIKSFDKSLWQEKNLILFENVKGLISMSNGELLPTSIDLFSSLGYDVQFQVLNAADYRDIEKLKGTHSHELSKIVWLPRSSDAKVLPKEMWQDFKNNNLPKDKERYING